MMDQTETIRALELKLAEREEQYQRTEKIQTALYQIADAASAATDLQQFYARLHEIVGGLMYARNFFVALLDAEAGVISWPYHEDEKDVDAETWAPVPYTEDRGVTSYVLRTGQTVHAAADAADLVESGELEIIGSFAQDGIVVPLQAQARTLGVLCVQSYEKGEVYSDEDVQVLQFVSQHIATALTRARAIEETLQRNNELAIINGVQEGLASKLELQAIIDLVGDKLRDVLHTDELGIRLYDETADLIHYLYEFEHGQRLQIEPRKPSALFRDLQAHPRPIFGPSLELSERYGFRNMPGTDVSRSLANVPIVAGDRAIGAIQVEDYEREDAFNESNIRLMQTIAASMGVALENARLFDQTQQLFKAEQQRAAELAIINSVQEGLASNLDMQAIYELVGEKIRATFGADTVGIMTYDASTGMLSDMYSFEKGDRTLVADPVPLFGFRKRVIESAEPLLINRDVGRLAEEYGNPVLYGQQAKSCIFVPMIVGKQATGVITVQNLDREDAYTESDVRLLETLANSMSVALENARLFGETQRLLKETEQRAAELAIINSVQEGLAAKLDYQAIIELVGDKIRDLFHSQNMSIRLYDREADLLSYPYLLESGSRLQMEPVALGTGLTAHIIRTRQPLVINERLEERMAELGSYWIGDLDEEKDQSYVGIPILTGDAAIGVVALDSKQEHAFSDPDVRLLQTLVNSMGVALENARLFDEVQKRNREVTEALEQQTATAEILRVIAGSPTDIKPVLVAVAEHAARLCEANDVQIYQADDGSLRQVTHFGPLPALQDGESLPLVPGLITGRAVLERRTIHVEDTHALSEAEYPESVALQARLGHRTAVSTPLLREEKAIGAIVVRRNEVRPFTAAQIGLLSTFADQAAIAIENVRLFNETRRLLKETEQRAAELSVINSVQQGLASKLDMQAIYDLVGDRIRDIFGTEVVYIAIRPAKNADQIEFPYYLDRGRRVYAEPVTLGQGITSRVIEARKPVVTGTMEGQLALGGIYDDGELSQSYLGVPIFLGDSVIGVASVQSYQKDAFSAADERLLSTLAASMGVALENARLFDETQRLLRETEQRAAELAIINSVQAGLASQLEMDAIYELVGNKVREIFKADSTYIGSYDKGLEVILPRYHLDRGHAVRLPEALPLGQGLYTHVIRSKKPLILGTHGEADRHARIYTPRVDTGKDLNESYLGVPLLLGDEVVGVIAVQSYQEHAYNEADARLLTTLANSLSVALENARLFAETQRLLKETEQRNAELAVINRVQEALAAKLDIQAIYEAVGDKIGEIFPKAEVGIRVHDPVTRLVHFPYTVEGGRRIQIDPIVLGDTGITHHVLSTHQAVLIDHNAEEEFAKLGSYTIPGTADSKSALYVPLMVGGEAKGLLSLHDLDREYAFSDSDVRLLTTIANSMSVALENARLFDETQRLLKETEQRAAELSIINSVQEGLASKLDMRAIYDLVGEKIREVFDAQVVLIDIFDRENETHELAYGFESGQRVTDDRPIPFSGVVRHLIATRQPVIINEHAELALTQYGMTIQPGTVAPKSLIVVPFGTPDQVNGYFSLQNLDREHAFGESDVRLLQTLASSMGIALENARLFNAEQQRAAELSAISAVSQALVAETDLDKMIELIGEKMRSTFGADIAYVALLDRSTNVINFPYMHGQELEPITYGEGLTSKIIDTAQPLLINRDMQQKRAELGTVRVGREARSYLGVPILAGGQAIGVLSVQSTEEENAFDENDVRLLSAIAANAGAAIRNAQLHAETQRRAQEMATLAEIGNDIAASRELDPVLERIAEHAKDILRVRQVSIGLRETEEEVFQTRVAVGEYADALKAMVVVPNRGIMGHILQSGKAEFVNYPASDPRAVHIPGTPEEEDAHQCLMGAPLISRGQTIGGIMTWRDHPDLFTQAELDFLVSVARQTAIAIESARLYLETQRRANEMSALAEVGREISSSLEPAVVLERIAARAKELLAGTSSAVFLYNADKSSMRAITALGQLERELKDDLIKPGEGIIGTLAQEGRAEFVNDTSRDARAIQIPGTQEVTHENLMAVPLFRGDEVTGMMAVWRTTHPFDEADLNFLIGLSRQAAIALENARLFDEIKRQGLYLETIFSNSPVAIVTVDENGRVLSWSPAAEKLFGYSRDEALGRDVDDLVASLPEVQAEARSYTHQGMGNQYVHRITKRTRKDGMLVDVDLSALPLPLENGKTGVVAIYNDIGEIQRQRKYYEAIVQNSPVAIVAVDEQSNVVSWNPGAEQLFGYDREEALGRNIDEMVAATAEIHAEANTYNQQARTDELHVITRRTRRDGSLVDVELSGVPLPLPTGKSGLVAIYHDITELQRARQEAVAANEAKSAFLATMSHEIRTPMNAVIGMSGLLLDTPLSREQRDYAETIRNSGDALLAIINDILDFSKIEAGKMDLEKQPFDLRECVESALDLVAGRAVEKNLDLAYIIDDDVPTGIRGDVTRLRQILLNLLSNAVKFTEHGEVVLTVRRDKAQDCLLFAVRDTGIGIPKNRMDRLFTSFSQADSSTTRRYGGTGLGLAISKRLAEMMGGTMWADSQGAGKGATFAFLITAEPAMLPERKASRELRGVQPALQGKRVLVVDDNATNRRILMLQTAKWGMEPRETESPREALKWLKRGEAFDLAILDLQMPEMDGVMLTRELRQIKQSRSLPVVLLTSLGRKEVGAEDIDFAAYLTKPLKPSALFDVVAGIFARNLVVPKSQPAKALIDTEMAANHPLRILLAEDNAVNQKLALRLLQQMGYRADVASNGLEAVDSVQRQEYDVLLMDVQMPEMDGLDATRAIRKLKGRPQPRIVAMTANAMQGDREMCIAAGMDDYISKPIRVAELSEALLKTPAQGTRRPAPARKSGHPAAKTAARKPATRKTGATAKRKKSG